MTRGEASGLIVAVVGHGLLILGFLFWGVFAAPNPVKLQPEAIEVSITDEVGLTSTAPIPSTEAPATKLGEIEDIIPPEPAPPVPVPEPAPAPAPRPEPAMRPAEKARPQPPRPPTTAPASPTNPRQRPDRPVQRTGRLDGITDGLTPDRSPGKAVTPPAAEIGPAVQSSIDAEIRRQLKRYWRAPTGADIEQLRTIVELRLNPDGSLAAEPRLVRQTGETPSNRPQKNLHFEAAVRAIKQAAPFRNLPEQYYDYWKRTGPAFDRRLSQ